LKLPDRNQWLDFFDKAIEGCLCLLALLVPLSKSGVEIFTAAGIVFFVLKKLVSPNFKNLKSKPDILLLLFFIFCSLSLLNSGIFLEKSLHSLLIKWGKRGLIFLIAQDTLRSPKKVKTVFAFLTLGAVLTGLDVLSQRYLGIEVFKHQPMTLIKHSFQGKPIHEFYGVTAAFNHYNSLANYLVCVLLLTAAVILSGKIRNSLRSVLVFVLILLGCGFFLTFSRGGWLAFLAGLILMFVVSGNRFVFFTLFIFISGFFVLPLPRERVAYTFLPHWDSQRLMIWKIAWRMIHENPFLGKGIGTFMDYCSKYSLGTLIRYAHNGYLQMWAEAGIFALASFLSFIGLLIVKGVIVFKKTLNYTILGFVCSVFGFFVHDAMDTGLYSLQLSALLWLLLGILAALVDNPDMKELW